MLKSVIKVPIDDVVRDLYKDKFKLLSPRANGYLYVRGVDPLGVVTVSPGSTEGVVYINRPELNMEAVAKHGFVEDELRKDMFGYGSHWLAATHYTVSDPNDPLIDVSKEYGFHPVVDGDEDIVAMKREFDQPKVYHADDDATEGCNPSFCEEAIQMAWSMNVLDMSAIQKFQDTVDAFMLDRKEDLMRMYDYAEGSGKYQIVGEVLNLPDILSRYEEYFDDLTKYIKSVIGDDRAVSGVFNESLEYRLVNPLAPAKVTLYHGSPKKLTTVEPNSMNMGSKLSGMRTSSFWVDSRGIKVCKTFGLDRLLRSMPNAPDYELREVKPGILTMEGLVIDQARKNDLIKYLNTHPVYIYAKTIDTKYVRVGHMDDLPEYTLDFRVKPDNVQVCRYDDLRDIITFAPISEVMRLYKITGSGKYQLTGFQGKTMRTLLAISEKEYDKRYDDFDRLNGVATEEAVTGITEKESKVLKALDADTSFRKSIQSLVCKDCLYSDAVGFLNVFIDLHVFVDKVHDNFIEISSLCGSAGNDGAAMINVYGYSSTAFLKWFVTNLISTYTRLYNHMKFGNDPMKKSENITGPYQLI